jgi:hypothetical protein
MSTVSAKTFLTVLQNDKTHMFISTYYQYSQNGKSVLKQKAVPSSLACYEHVLYAKQQNIFLRVNAHNCSSK